MSDGAGYEIESRRDSRGKDHGFEIRGVTNELLEKYSVRSAQRDAAVERFIVEHGRKPTNNEVAILVRESRAEKLAEIATEKVREQQQRRLAQEERQVLQHLRAESLERSPMIHREFSQASESLGYPTAPFSSARAGATPRLNDTVDAALAHRFRRLRVVVNALHMDVCRGMGKLKITASSAA